MGIRVNRSIVVVSCAILAAAGAAWAYPTNPPTAHTAAPPVGVLPAEESCTQCHGDNAVNSGGSITLQGLPVNYSPGTMYMLTVHLESTQLGAVVLPEWGFQLTVASDLTGRGAGTLANAMGAGTKVVAGTDTFVTRQYIEPSTQNHPGEGSPVEWQIQWTAPPIGTGTVEFFFTGLAANNNSSASGDWVYTGSADLPEGQTAVRPETWSIVKALYRD